MAIGLWQIPPNADCSFLVRQAIREEFLTCACPMCRRQVDAGRESAQGKAESLLKSWLTPEQKRQYDATRSFEVTGGSTGKRYVIRSGASYNVDELGDDGSVARRLCFAPGGYLAVGDVMLGQKIALECREDEALGVANAVVPYEITFRAYASRLSAMFVERNEIFEEFEWQRWSQGIQWTEPRDEREPRPSRPAIVPNATDRVVQRNAQLRQNAERFMAARERA